ncbi:hypothetical protein [Tenacibaculum ovolyticum]|uniref:hypothetical protein n=1 Tax=Tenacibaculum ovolyticum TaxID=104270 RepID=UPI0007EE1210|nr:hypothetical protein [Tenacibaculum ovolyticum]
MDIKKWIENKGNYKDGILLYSQLSKHNKLLLKKFKQKETKSNFVKLRYELQKNIAATIEVKAEKRLELPIAPVFISEEKVYRKVLLKELPFELHESYRDQKDNYYKATSLHLQLTALKPHEHDKALGFCIEIEELFDSIEKTWELLDYYKEHGRILETKNEDFSLMSETDLLLTRMSRRSSLTRAKERLQLLNSKYKKSNLIADKQKYERKIGDKKAHIIKLKLDIDRLNNLIITNQKT